MAQQVQHACEALALCAKTAFTGPLEGRCATYKELLENTVGK